MGSYKEIDKDVAEMVVYFGEFNCGKITGRLLPRNGYVVSFEGYPLWVYFEDKWYGCFDRVSKDCDLYTLPRETTRPRTSSITMFCDLEELEFILWQASKK